MSVYRTIGPLVFEPCHMNKKSVYYSPTFFAAIYFRVFVTGDIFAAIYFCGLQNP